MGFARCYMEVAVFTSLHRSIRFACQAAVLTTITFGLMGCTSDVQVLTYAKQSRMQGIRLYNEGNHADAAGAFRNSIKQDPRDYRSHYYLGVSYEALNSYQQAIQSYKSCLEVMKVTYEGREDQAFRLRAIDSLASVIARQDERGLEKDLLEKQARGRQVAEDYFLLAKVYRFGGDADSATDAYNRAALMDPRDFYILKDYGLYLVQLGQNPRAEAPLRKAYALNATDVEVAAGLRQLGIVPGPAIKDEKDLIQPPIPKGPIPEVDLAKITGRSNPSAAPLPPSTITETAQTPKD